MRRACGGLIRPPDPLVATPTLVATPYGSVEAVRRCMHLGFRDCASVLDLTYGGGGFWREPLPPGIVLYANVYPRPEGDLPPRTTSFDFTAPSAEAVEALGSAGPIFDLVVYDPPHLADAGTGGLMRARYGTERGSVALERMIRRGAACAFRHASRGVLVKVADHAHGGRLLTLGHWVEDVAERWGWTLHFRLHAYRASNVVDPKWKVQRVPRSNLSTYLAFRRERSHRDFEREWDAQEKRKGGHAPTS